MDEFGKIGRTWWFIIVVFVSTTVLLAIKSIPIDIWKDITYACLGSGTIKSTAVGVAQLIIKPKTEGGQ